MSGPVRVLLVDDHPVVRAGYRHLLQTDPGIEVIAEASHSAAACEAFKALAPDVVVMDISLPGVSGIEAMTRMRSHRPDARVLIFSMHEEEIFASRAMSAGAAGFLSKSSAPEKLVAAVRAVARGECYIEPARVGAAAADSTAPAARLGVLSAREAEVLRLWAQGLQPDEIGARLGVSGKTVANYQSLVRHKLGVHNDVQLMRLAEQIWSGRSELLVR
jgi:two-component system, NarL family, invasion response regulator UvrY